MESRTVFVRRFVLSERPQEPLSKRTVPRRDLSDPTLNLPGRHPLERSAASRLTRQAQLSLSVLWTIEIEGAIGALRQRESPVYDHAEGGDLTSCALLSWQTFASGGATKGVCVTSRAELCNAVQYVGIASRVGTRRLRRSGDSILMQPRPERIVSSRKTCGCSGRKQ